MAHCNSYFEYTALYNIIQCALKKCWCWLIILFFSYAKELFCLNHVLISFTLYSTSLQSFSMPVLKVSIYTETKLKYNKCVIMYIHEIICMYTYVHNHMASWCWVSLVFSIKHSIANKFQHKYNKTSILRGNVNV